MILFILSYYTFNYSRNASSYFQKIVFLEYGFKKGAQYSIFFNDSNSEMVFGFATKKEAKQIKKLQNHRELCKGTQQLSKIQYYINGYKEASGQIQSKSILTPYAFTCDTNYTINLILNYLNGDSHIDYRCQDLAIVTPIFAFFICVYVIIYLFYSIYRCKSLSNCCFYFIIASILIIISIKNIFSSIYWIKNKKLEIEYFYDSYLLMMSNSVFSSEFGVIFSEAFISLIIIIFYTSYGYFFLFECVRPFLGVLGFLFSIVYNFITIFYGIYDKLIIGSWISFAGYLILILFTHPFCSFVKTGLIIYLIGVYFTSMFSVYLVDITQEKIATHYLFFIFQIISIVTQIIAIVFIQFGLKRGEDFDKPPVDSTPIHHNRPTYTLNTVNNDINIQNYGNLVEEINVNDDDMNDPLLNYGISYEANTSIESDQAHNNNPN